MYLSRIRLRPEVEAVQLGLLLKDRSGYGLHRLFWGLFSDNNATECKRNFLFREEVAAEQDGRNSPRSASGRKGDPVYYVLSAAPPQENPLFDIQTKHYAPRLAEGDRLAFKLRVNAVVSRRTGENQSGGKSRVVRHDIVMDAQHQWIQDQLDILGLQDDGAKKIRIRRILDYATDQLVSEWRHFVAQGPYAERLEARLGRQALLQWAMRTAESRRVLKWWQDKAANHGFEVGMGKSGLPALEVSGYRWHPLPEKHRTAGFSSLDLSGEVRVRDADKFTHMLMTGIGPAKAFGCGLMLVRRV
ncbi:type I-E CRISPR-associated protein Cas6/Cse3/CasE [Hahella sp. SMD15-11]|uniref:Type I-E CRISPR-associated protein Cas6/Cse3/CasE n=1 Tax=Thermohahella caldifontis TaxID=3142973 RepID=A0AB39UUU3_9GAMM